MNEMGVHFFIPYLTIGLGLLPPVVHTIWVRVPEDVRWQMLCNYLRARHFQPLLDRFENNNVLRFRETQGILRFETWSALSAAFIANASIGVQKDPQRRYWIHSYPHPDKVWSDVNQEQFLNKLSELFFWFDLVNTILDILSRQHWMGHFCKLEMYGNNATVDMSHIGTISFRSEGREPVIFLLEQENNEHFLTCGNDRFNRAKFLTHLAEMTQTQN